MTDERARLIGAQVLYLRSKGWTCDGDGMWAKPGSSEFVWDADHAILCEHSGHRDVITGYKPIVRGAPANACEIDRGGISEDHACQ